MENFIERTGMLKKQNVLKMIRILEESRRIKFTRNLVNLFYLHNGEQLARSFIAKTIMGEVYAFSKILAFDSEKANAASIQNVNKRMQKYISEGLVIAKDYFGNLLVYKNNDFYVYDCDNREMRFVTNKQEFEALLDRPKVTESSLKSKHGCVYDSKECINAMKEYTLYKYDDKCYMYIQPFNIKVPLTEEKLIKFLNDPAAAADFAYKKWDMTFR